VRDYDNIPETYRARRRLEQQGGLDRSQRLQITMGVGAAFFLLLGAAIGFGLGRSTAPVAEKMPSAAIQTESSMTAGVVEEVPTDTIDPEFAYGEEPTESVEATPTDETAPKTPKQTLPANGAKVSGSRVYLRWNKVTDESGVKYAFEIQDLRSNGTYGNTQVIKDLKSTSYSARVLSVKRRWRVWAVDGEGNASKKSGWRSYTKKVTPTVSRSKTTTPTASDETT